MFMEYRHFRQLDSTWKTTMDTPSKDHFLLESVSTDPTTLNQFKDANNILDEIQKSMHQYLETKRLAFPLFFFLSDEDLLDIFSQTKDPLKVQPHLNKCFEAIDRVEFTDKLEVTHLISPEKEKIQSLNKICERGRQKRECGVLDGRYRKSMCKIIQDITKKSLAEYQNILRNEWVRKWPSILVLTVSQIMWTAGVDSAIKNNRLREYEETLTKGILGVVMMVPQ